MHVGRSTSALNVVQMVFPVLSIAGNVEQDCIAHIIQTETDVVDVLEEGDARGIL